MSHDSSGSSSADQVLSSADGLCRGCREVRCGEVSGDHLGCAGWSSATGRRTRSSDIDLLLIGDEQFADVWATHAVYESEGEIFEAFGYTQAGFEHWAGPGSRAAGLFTQAAELMLLRDRRWLGTGRYLPRRLRELSPERAESLSQPLLRGDFAAFGDQAEQELNRAGGRMLAGFVRR